MSDLESLILKYSTLGTSRHGEEAEQIIGILEKIHPVTESDWLTVIQFFKALPSETWVDIMTVRFLDKNPQHSGARIARCTYLLSLPQKLDMLESELRIVSTLALHRGEDHLNLSSIYARLGKRELSAQHVAAAVKLAPDDEWVRVVAVHQYINLEDFPRAKAQIDKIWTEAAGNVGTMLTALSLANRMNYQPFMAAALDAIIPQIPAENHEVRSLLIPFALKASRIDYVTMLMDTIDFSQISSAGRIEEVYFAIEGRGFYNQERTLIESGLKVYPDNSVLLNARRRQGFLNAQQFPIFQANVTTTASRRFGRFAMLERLLRRFKK